jgi:cobalt-precorrin 5A hydrolase
MKIAIIAITEEGKKVALKLQEAFEGSEIYLPSKDHTLKRLVGEIFPRFEGIVFIMAMGIVIRMIRPHLRDKYKDPAVVVVDEKGRYAISALSGHEGGANRLAMEVASYLDAEPVITTASETGKNLLIGIGCRKGTTKKDIVEAIDQALQKGGLSRETVRSLATIDFKRDEPGILQAGLEMGIPVRTIPFDLIKRFQGPYQKSSFVKEKIGVEGVSEPCALLSGKRTALVVPKLKRGGVCVAIAKED